MRHQTVAAHRRVSCLCYVCNVALLEHSLEKIFPHRITIDSKRLQLANGIATYFSKLGTKYSDKLEV